LPMNTVPKRLMGVTSGVINMAGQIAAFLSPVLVGYLVGAAKGKYNFAFMLLIGSLLVSCVIVFTLPSKVRHPEEVRDGG
jgi:nitrate/nitrite transporter NarK